jgi:hypothetical protein
MEKTYSQKVARAFEIIDYFLLIPAGIGALVGLVAIGSIPLYALLLYAVLITGIVLLVGYFKHSRNTLNPDHISALWLTSAVYNFLLLLPSLYYVATLYQNHGSEEMQVSMMQFLFPLAVVFAYIMAITLSLKAYSFEKYRKIYGLK